MQQSDISILIVEDQTLMRQGLKTILDLEPGMRVVGEAKDGAEGVREALGVRPDIILMDVQMPVMNGVDATRAIVAAWSQARVIVLTTFDRDDYVFQSIRAGAMGYLLKDAPADTLIQTIRRVYAGDVFIQPEIASRTLREVATGRQRAEAQPFDLSEREREVLVLLAQGLSNREIAGRLHITEGTVKNHVSNILAKLQAENRTQAAAIARREGLMGQDREEG
jgi:DNA-binding NarL/FixJ family response regulator